MALTAQSTLRITLLTTILFCVISATHGVDPSYKECRPHIDATIRDLASKALNAGEQPSKQLDQEEVDEVPLNDAASDNDEDKDVPIPPSTAVNHESDDPVEEKPAHKEKNPDSPPVVPKAPLKAPKIKEIPTQGSKVPETTYQDGKSSETSSSNDKTSPRVHTTDKKPKQVPETPTTISVEKSVPQVSRPPVAPAAAVPTPVYTPPPKENIINRFIYAVFGEISDERDAKWAKPWKSHREHKRMPVFSGRKESVDTSSGVMGEAINKFVATFFGNISVERDAKWAQPWQTHEEHRSKAVSTSESEQRIPKEIGPSGGIIHNLVTMVFPNPTGSRDPKYAQPWQTHADQEGKFDSYEKTEEKFIAQATGGILDAFVKLVFPTELGERDPKYAKPWQTHADQEGKFDSYEKTDDKYIAQASGGILDAFVRLVFPTQLGERDPKYAKPWQTHEKIGIEEEYVPVTRKAEAMGGPIDKLVMTLFNVDKNAKRDPKYARPWQTHPEHAGAFKSHGVDEVKQKVVVVSGGVPGFGYIDNLITGLFGSIPSDRDEKWAQPWQTHSEHHSLPSSKLPQEKKVYSATGGVFDNMIKYLFGISGNAKRDPKWNKAWQTHAESTNSVPISSPPAVPTQSSPPEVKISPEPPSVEKISTTESVKNKIVKPTKDSSKPSTNEKFPAVEDSGDSEEEAPSPTVPSVADSPTTAAEKEEVDEEDDEEIILVPSSPRKRNHIEAILGLDEPSRDASKRSDPISDASLRELKDIYSSSVKPLEETYKYRDISNRHMSDAEIFAQPLVLMLGPYSTGKSTFLNYLMGLEFTKRALKTGAHPSHGVFRIIKHGSEDQELDGTDLSADFAFRSLQKFGQNFIDQLRGHALNVPLLKKVTFVEAPGILEMRRSGERQYPFNDVLQWFIDRADLVLVMFDYTKLDAGYELEAALDQLKGREGQVRILLNKADQIPPEELIKVQGSLFWNLSPLLGVSVPPTVYTGSFSSRPYRNSSPAKLFQAQEEALLHDIARAVNNRVDNRVAIGRRHAVRVRNHAQMVDTYLSTYNKNKGFLTSKHILAEDIVENPHHYNIYEGMSQITNVSRYDLPDPEIYRDFFRVHNLYDFPALKDACSYISGCPLDKIDKAISTDLPELLAKYRRLLTRAGIAPLPSASDIQGSDMRAAMPQQTKY